MRFESRFLAIGVLLAASPRALAGSDVAEVFADKGETYIRAGSSQGVGLGTSLSVVGPDDRKVLGTATVLEVFPGMARVSLDDAATKASGKKYVRLTAAKQTTSAPSGGDAAPAAGGLIGHAAFSGVGPAVGHKVVVYNDGAVEWTHCDLRLPTNLHYLLERLPAKQSESIMVFKFKQDGAAYDRPIDSITVKCSQGRAKFTFSM